MVQKVKVNSSVELYDNRSDESRVYDIEANVHIAGTLVSSMDGANVFRDGLQVANFNCWESNHLNITYMGVDEEEQTAVNGAVNAFIREVKETVANI